MFDLQAWQWIAALAVGVISVGIMSFFVRRVFSRPASLRATVRRVSRLESGLFEQGVPEGARVFDAWAFRLAARFAGRSRITVYPDRVVVAGPRVPRPLYEAWIWAQSLLLALVFPSLLLAIVALDWRWLVVGVVTWLVSYGISFGGAGLWPGLGELFHEQGRFMGLDLPRASIHELDIGKGWSKGGFGVVLFPYKAGIDKMSEGLAVSFFAPDEHGREVRFAFAMYSAEEARELSETLTAATPGRETLAPAEPGREKP